MISKKLINGLALLLLAFCLSFTVLSIVKNCSEFSFITAGESLTIIVAITLVYIASGINQTNNKRKACLEKVINELRDDCNDSILLRIANDCGPKIKNDINMFTKRLDSKIIFLEEYAKEYKYDKEIGKIKEQIDDLKNFIGEHITDNDYLSKSVQVFRKYMDNISNAAMAILFKLS